ncbi:MAG: aconitase family protein [Pedobacter sp.]|jgi:3-isopropylmalate/(R)-2-methylmalate dehydratase large subunit
MAQTLFDKIWNEHVVSRNAGFPDTLYIDTHIINKVTSPAAFEGLRKRGIPVLRPEQTIVLTEKGLEHIPLSDLSRFQIDLLQRNCSDFELEKVGEYRSGESLPVVAFPGQTVICDIKHAGVFGALGAMAIGINDFLVEQVLATQCLLINKPKRMKIEVNGKLNRGIGIKDINHYLISEITADGANDYFIEYGGDTLLNMDMEDRIALCSLSKEIGAVGGLIAPDQTTLEYVFKHSSISYTENIEETLCFSRSLISDESAVYDEVLEFDAEDIRPGNYGIGLSKLITSRSSEERYGMITFEGAAIIAGYNDTDYLMSRLEEIEEFENNKVLNTYKGHQNIAS